MPILVKHHNVWKSVTAGSSVDINLDTSSPLGAPDWDEEYSLIDDTAIVIEYSKDETSFRIEHLLVDGDITTTEYYISGDSGATFTLLGTKAYTYDAEGTPISAIWTPHLSES